MEWNNQKPRTKKKKSESHWTTNPIDLKINNKRSKQLFNHANCMSMLKCSLVFIVVVSTVDDVNRIEWRSERSFACRRLCVWICCALLDSFSSYLSAQYFFFFYPAFCFGIALVALFNWCKTQFNRQSEKMRKR